MTTTVPATASVPTTTTTANVLYPPYNFGVVGDSIFRSGFPTALNYEHLRTLHLRTVIVLTSNEEEVDEKFMIFCREYEIACQIISCSLPIAEDTVVEALTSLVNGRNWPLLIMCEKGTHLTSAVIGCYRKMQNWALVSTFEEYRRFCGYTASFTQQQHEQFIELFDTDLVKRFNSNINVNNSSNA